MNLYIPRHAGHNPPRNANTLRRFGSLNKTADMPHFSRFFYICNSLLQPFSMGGRRWEAIRLLVRFASLPTRLFAVRQRLEAQANNPAKTKKEAL